MAKLSRGQRTLRQKNAAETQGENSLAKGLLCINDIEIRIDHEGRGKLPAGGVYQQAGFY